MAKNLNTNFQAYLTLQMHGFSARRTEIMFFAARENILQLR